MKIAQRLHYRTWREDRLFEETLAFLTAHKDAVDEITLFPAIQRTERAETMRIP